MPDDSSVPRATIVEKARRLQGPILVLGASGFVGANLMRSLFAVRKDVYGTTTRKPAWRLEDLPEEHVQTVDLIIESNLDALLALVQPRSIFNCVAYGAYSFETDSQLIYRTNFHFITRLLARLESNPIACYVHAGTSSEYGDNAAAPPEDAPLAPNSDYAVSKTASAQLIHFYGKRKRFPCANLRLYSVFGPLEDSSRLIPTLIRYGLDGTYPEFVNPGVSRDFVFTDDVTEAFVDTALNLTPANYGESFNIGTGQKTTIREIAAIARELFGIASEPTFSMPERQWDVRDWYANIDKARDRLRWQPHTTFLEGLKRTIEWYQSLPDKEKYAKSSKKYGLDIVYSVSAVVACYNDRQAIPIVYERLKATFTKLNIDFEIIFVNEGATDDSEEVIRIISLNDRRVIGITHSRIFGPPSAFRSGMEIASKNSCVLLYANLKDPPELIEQFVMQWRAGYDVVFGRRENSQSNRFGRFANSVFYRAFNAFSYTRIPPNAGDFSLLEKRVVQAVLKFPERDFFLRGIRAFAGFKQIGVPYQPEPGLNVQRKRGLIQTIRMAQYGILSFSNVPVTMLSLLGIALLLLSLVLGTVQVVVRILYPERSASGITTVLLVILFFGALNAFSLGLLGEYVGRIFEEVKRRPHFIRSVFIKDGELRRAAENLVTKEI
jgi:dolichol-phosphate mannosyltransferase